MTAPGGTLVDFDAFTTGPTFSGSTFSHTVGSGSNRSLEVFVLSLSAPVTAVTYNGVAMTQIAATTISGYPFYIFGLLSPPSGTNTVSMTCSSAMAAVALSHTGVGSYGATLPPSNPLTSSLGDAAVMWTSSLDSGCVSRGAFPTGGVIEEGWGTPTVTAAGNALGANLVGAGGGGGPAPSTTNFAGFF